MNVVFGLVDKVFRFLLGLVAPEVIEPEEPGLFDVLTGMFGDLVSGAFGMLLSGGGW